MGWFEDLSASQQSQTSGIRVAPETALEQFANPMLQRQLQGLEGLVGKGPGEADFAAGAQGMRDYAAQLGQYSTAQGLLGAQQAGIEQYSKLGDLIFGGQLRQQQQEAARLAGRSGRQTSDPMLQAKLAQQRADMVGGFAAQQSMQLPFQLAQFGGQRAEALQGLASQAMANRQALLGMGSQLREQDRGYRINTGERYTTQRQEGSFLSTLGGIAGIAGTVMGGIGALGAGGIIGGGAKGASGGLGDKMTGMLGVGGGAGGGGGFNSMLGIGSLATGGANLMNAVRGASGGAAGGTNYNMPVGQGFTDASGRDIFAGLNADTSMVGKGFGLPYSSAPSPYMNPGARQNMFTPSQGSAATYSNPDFALSMPSRPSFINQNSIIGQYWK